MEWNIADLLDDVQDLSPDIETKPAVSRQRVRELTLRKIREHKAAGKRHPFRFSVRVAVIAAVLLCLSITVLAAVSWLHSDPENAIGYDNDLYIGSASKNWEVEGWLLELKAEKVTPAGLTVVCTEWGGAGQRGVLTTDSHYWLERWTGSGYARYLPERSPAGTESKTEIKKNTAASWEINWETVYGTLAPGHYRLGKIFTQSAGSDRGKTMTCYVKFSILEEKMAGQYGQYTAAMERLLGQAAWHLTYQVFPESPTGYTSHVTEIWKAEEAYLQKLSYLDANGGVLKQEGAALLNGVGYRLRRDAGEEAMQHKADPSVKKDDFYLWETFSGLSAADIDEIKTEGNTVIYIQRADSPTEIDWETAVTFGGAGQLLEIKQYAVRGETKTLYSILSVYDTDPQKIEQVITMQKPEER